MNLFFVRHGQTDDNSKNIVQGRTDNPLNDLGREQVRITGQKLQDMHISFDVLCCSPLIRAKESAEIINSFLHIDDFRVEEGLNERAFGVLEGYDVFKMRELLKDKSFTCEGFENDETICKRVYNCIEELRTSGENILLVCHSHTIKAFLNCIDKKYDFNYPLQNAQIVHIIYNKEYTIKSL